MNEKELFNMIKNEKDLPEEAKKMLMGLFEGVKSGKSKEEITNMLHSKLREITGVNKEDMDRLEVNYSMMLSLAETELEGWEKRANFRKTRDESRVKILSRVKLSLFSYMKALDVLSYEKNNGFYSMEQLNKANIPLMDFVSYFMQLAILKKDSAQEIDIIKVLRVKNETDSIGEEGIFNHTKIDELLLVFSIDANGQPDIDEKREQVLTAILAYIVDQVERTIGKEFFQWVNEDYYVHQAWRIAKVSGKIKNKYNQETNINEPEVKQITEYVKELIDKKLKS